MLFQFANSHNFALGLQASTFYTFFSSGVQENKKANKECVRTT